MSTSLKPTDLFKLLGTASGGKSATILAAGALNKVQGGINSAAEKLGAKIGIYTGGTLFASLAKGAQRTDSQQVDEIAKENTGYSLTDMKGLAILAAIGIAITVFMRRK